MFIIAQPATESKGNTALTKTFMHVKLKAVLYSFCAVLSEETELLEDVHYGTEKTISAGDLL